MEDDYLLDDDDELEEGYFQPIVEEDDEDEEEGSDIVEESQRATRKEENLKYEEVMSLSERKLLGFYDDIVAAGRNNKENAIEDAAYVVVSANPKHTSAATIGYIVKDLFHKQGHSRMQNSIYTPDSPLKGADVDEELGVEDSSFNVVFAQEARDQIARFIDYLANRDLSKDSIVSRRRKQRHIPAFIIFLFSSGLYDLIINCPTMPPEYAKQIEEALQKIMDSKYDLVEKLAQEYEARGRDKVAERVRRMQLSWFLKEPAEIRTSSDYSDLDLTYDDMVIYREYRSRFTAISKSITQDVISDLIEVVIGDGVYEKLKDKTRSEAIADVKRVYKEWSKDNASSDSDLAKKVIWNDV